MQFAFRGKPSRSCPEVILRTGTGRSARRPGRLPPQSTCTFTDIYIISSFPDSYRCLEASAHRSDRGPNTNCDNGPPQLVTCARRSGHRPCYGSSLAHRPGLQNGIRAEGMVSCSLSKFGGQGTPKLTKPLQAHLHGRGKEGIHRRRALPHGQGGNPRPVGREESI